MCVTTRSDMLCQAASHDVESRLFLQDFGARDPTAGEIGSGFGNKTLGNFDTAHVIRCADKAHFRRTYRN